MATTNQPATLQEAIRYYSDLSVCQDALVAARWPEGVECPHCGSKDVRYLANQKRWQCNAKPRHARSQFSAKVGTIFEDSPIGLDKWFVAIWLISSAKNGISSYEISRAIGVTQKSAWFMLHRIRLAMQTRTFQKIGGEVEVDETFIGGKARWMNGQRKRAALQGRRGGQFGKVAVMGLLERHGKDGHSTVRMEVLPDTKQATLDNRVRKHLSTEERTILYTDAHTGYARLHNDFTHFVIDHAEAYVDGHVHTNTCENFWSLLKRGLRGTYISVEPFHLFRYLDEQAFRFNSRKQKDGDRFVEMTKRVTGRRVTYKELTGKADAQAVV